MSIPAAQSLSSTGPPKLAAADARLLGELYEAHADAIFRALARWGVRDASLDDALQETFLVASRKLGEFEGRSTHLTWLFGIALRVARGVRRARTHEPLGELEPPAEGSVDEAVEARRAAVLLDRLLSDLDDDQREVFVLAELEELTAPEIAEITGAKLNTVYSRLRLARRAVNDALARHRASGSREGAASDDR
jgi:RNA polymerase sigma-70 factor (ECF subfamily)